MRHLSHTKRNSANWLNRLSILHRLLVHVTVCGATELQFVVQKRGGGGGGGGTDGNTSCATPSREVAITDLVFFPMTAISY